MLPRFSARPADGRLPDPAHVIAAFLGGLARLAANGARRRPPRGRPAAAAPAEGR